MTRFLSTITLIIGICVNTFAQSGDSIKIKEGIKFESGLSWQAILAKAKAENKYIFMDCYATWCGPCKWMNKNVFPDKEVGEYYNKNFINVAVQMDKTANDTQSEKDWYSDADMLHKNFNIHVYPSYLFFSPDGEIVHRVTGASSDKMEFIAKGKDAMDPEKQYYNVMERWKAHRGDSAFLLQVLKIAMTQRDMKHAVEISDSYLDCLNNPIVKDNISIITKLIQTNEEKYEKGFRLFLENALQIDLLMHDSVYVEKNIARQIFEDEITPLFSKKNSPIRWDSIAANLLSKYKMLSPLIISFEESIFQAHIKVDLKTVIYAKNNIDSSDWSSILKEFESKYPGYLIEPLFLERKTKYYAMQKMWNQCADAAYSYIHLYGDQISSPDMNNIVWDFIFTHSNDRKILLEAVKWIERPANLNKNPSFMDTYANLLYKLGNKEEGISWDIRAVEKMNEIIGAIKPEFIKNNPYLIINLNALKANLEKMQEGIPTWEEDISIR